MKTLQTAEDLKSFIGEVKDFPKPGVSFKDISPLLANPEALNFMLDEIISTLPDHQITSILAIEARGFLVGSILAVMNNASLIMVRKHKKLVPDPFNTIRFESKNEYGSEIFGLNLKYISPAGLILIHDDVLATGGTALSVYNALISKGYLAENIYFSFLIELSFLKGRELILSQGVNKSHISSIIKY